MLMVNEDFKPRFSGKSAQVVKSVMIVFVYVLFSCRFATMFYYVVCLF